MMPPPRDFEEEDLGPSSQAFSAAPPGAPGERTPLAWGSVGSRNLAGLLADHSGRSGVLRVVEGGVRYQAPPLARVWQPVIDLPQHYEMPWPGDARHARSLGQLGAELRAARQHGTLTAGDPRLRRLDELVAKVLDLAGGLHCAGWRVGLLHPDNLLAGPADELVPVDLGYSWHGTFAPPDWLTRNPFAALWAGDDPVRRQRADPHPDQLPVTADVRLLGRLLACILSGDRGNPFGDVSGAPVWKALREAERGTLASAEALREALAQAPLSAHFLTGVPRRRRDGARSGGLGVVLAVLATALLGVGVWYGWHSYMSRGGGLEPADADAWQERPADPPAGTAWGDLVRDFEQASADEQVRLLKRLYAHPPETDPAREKLRLRWAAYLRGRCLERWMEDYHACESRALDPEVRFEVAGQVQALHDRLERTLRELPPAGPTLHEREQQCLEFAAQRARELGLN
jgi:hypothetical protein